MRRNRAIQDYYEPGSTFKIVTASAAFEEKPSARTPSIDASAGHIRFGARVINDDHNYGVLSFADVIVRSSNVGAIKVALKLGPQKIGDYVKRFGFGRPTSPDFRGESPGMVWDPSSLNDSALASVAMGYQVGVTPLQMAAAVSAVANGGQLVQPRAVRAVIRDGRRLPVPHKTLDRVASAGTMATLTGIMERVVDDGTGKLRESRRLYRRWKDRHRQEAAERQLSWPLRLQRVVCRLRALAETGLHDRCRCRFATWVSPYGGVVAAPIFQKIATAALRHDGVPPSINAPEPVLAGRRDETGQRSTSGPLAPPPTVMPLTAAVSDSASEVPDLTGMSARDALGALTRLGCAAELRGAGLVVDQWPAPGTPLDSSLTVVLTLDRRTDDRATSVEGP